MRTITQETAPQTALRNCSKKLGGQVSRYVIFEEGEVHAISWRSLLVTRSRCHHEGFQCFSRQGGDTRIGVPVSAPQPELFSGGVENQVFSWSSLYRGRWQVPICSWRIQEEINNCKYLSTHIGAPQYIRWILTAIKGEINTNTVIVGDFNIALTLMDRSSRQK